MVDGMRRCGWAEQVDPLYQRYHDEEWGKVVRGDRELFERISLEGFQAGLSWWSVLQRREAFRAAFADFDPRTLSHWGDAEAHHLMADTSIIRNRAKINAVLTNARVVAAMAEGELTDLVWSFAPPPAPAPIAVSDLPAVTVESTALSKALKKRGLVFLGPTTCYALMQACGLVNDHLRDCGYREPVGR